MTVAVLVIVSLLALVFALAFWWAQRTRVLSSRYREQVVVTTKSGESFAGVLYSSDRAGLVLRGCEAVGAGENRTNLPLDGELILLLADVAYLQRL